MSVVFSKRGFNFKQIRRNERAAIYRQIFGDDGSPAFEVVIPVTRSKCRTAVGWEPCPPYEGYPSSEQWGQSGWTFTNLDQANQKLEEISQDAISSTEGFRQNRFDCEKQSE